VSYQTKDLYVASFLVSQGHPFPSVTREPERDGRPGRPIFCFEDNDGSVQDTANEYFLDDPQGVGAQVSAPRLFQSFDAIKRVMGPKPEWVRR
jgi:hypothetical protein